jgi:chemotaxis protein histidine kinase CheA
VADRIQVNLGVLRELAGAHAFLFADTPAIVLKAADDLTALVKTRIAEHDQAEAAKAEALRARIAEEERAKAHAEAARVAEEAAAAERARVAAETKRQLDEQAAAVAAARAQEAAAQAAVAVQVQTEPQNIPEIIPEPTPAAQVTPIPTARPAVTGSMPPSLRLGQIADRLGFDVRADFLARLGFAPAATDKAAKLYHEADFPMICAALVRHITAAAQAKAA